MESTQIAVLRTFLRRIGGNGDCMGSNVSNREAFAVAGSAQRAELFRLMVEAVQDHAVILLDPQGIVVDWNIGEERILGYHESEILGRHFSLFFTEEDIRAGRPEHELTEVSTRGVGEDDNWLVRKDGSRFFASGTTTALQDGTLRGYAKIVRDLTERKRLEDEAKKRPSNLPRPTAARTNFWRCSRMSCVIRSLRS